MKCPACYNVLRQIQVGSLMVDVCQRGCGGIWFDAFELQKVDEEQEAAGEHLVNIEKDPQVTIDPSRKRVCPRCTTVKLSRHLFSPKCRVEVDECPNCGGYWLDAGELATIRAQITAAKTFEQARKVPLTAATLRYLY